MIRLSKSQVFLIHEQLIAEEGESASLRDEGMLDFCIAGRTQDIRSESLSLSSAAAISFLFYLLIPHHPLHILFHTPNPADPKILHQNLCHIRT